MPVIFRGTSIRPAPQVALTKSYVLSGDGRQIGTTINGRVIGKITAEKTDDTYTPLPIEDRLATVLIKQSELRSLFSQNGLFEIQGYDANPPMKLFAIIDSVDTPEGQWTDISDYSISFHANGVFGEDDIALLCESINETWNFEEGDVARSWKATHSVSAKGKLIYDVAGNIGKLPWEVAKDFVNTKLGVGWTTVGDITWSPNSGESLVPGSAVQPITANAWNRAVTEEINETDGTYSLTETWTLSPNPWTEEYTISIQRVDEPGVTSTSSISGTIHGLRSNMTDQDEKYRNALSYWNTVSDLLVTRCQSVVPIGTTLNSHPITFSSDHDQINGTIQYKADFDDKVYTNDTYETYVISRSISDEDYHTSVKIDGTITGALYLDDGPSKTIKYTRASLQWNIVKALIFARVVQETGINSLKPFPVSAQITPDKNNGTVSYSYEFTDQTPNSVKHEYTVTKRYSRQDGSDIVTIEGTITGLRTNNSNSPFGTGGTIERYNNALTYWNGMSSNILGLASQYVNTQCLNPTPMSTSVGHNPLQGTISYSNEFSSQIMPATPGAISEVVTIQNDYAIPVIATIPVLGDPEGPVIQDLRTITEKKKTVSIEIVMTPPKFGCATIVAQPIVDITSYIPVGIDIYKTQDTDSWVPNGARYNRTISWIYK